MPARTAEGVPRLRRDGGALIRPFWAATRYIDAATVERIKPKKGVSQGKEGQR